MCAVATLVGVIGVSLVHLLPTGFCRFGDDWDIWNSSEKQWKILYALHTYVLWVHASPAILLMLSSVIVHYWTVQRGTQFDHNHLCKQCL